MREATKGTLSKKNPYYIPKYRYYELKYRCLQYKEWADQRRELDLYLRSVDHTKERVDGGETSDPVYEAMIKRAEYDVKMYDIDRALESIGEFYEPIKCAVTKGFGWSFIQALYSLTCTRDEYYNAYHKFFYVLDKLVL